MGGVLQHTDDGDDDGAGVRRRTFAAGDGGSGSTISTPTAMAAESAF
jgi:hypothetical protein